MAVCGEQILARSLSVATIEDEHGNTWQYHSRSDRHSKISCWGVLFDLLQTCALLRRHVLDQKLVFGINHQLTDFVTGKHKNMDLVVCRPATSPSSRPIYFRDLQQQYGIALDSSEA